MGDPRKHRSGATFLLPTAGPLVVTGSQVYEYHNVPLPLLRKKVTACTPGF